MKRVSLRASNSLFVALLVAAGLTLFLAQAGVSFAHAHLKTANILPNATISSVPAQLTLTFDEETSPTETRLQVLDTTGKAVDKGDLKVDGANARVSLGSLTDGKYTVKFRSFTEDDSAIVNGQYDFTVAKSGTTSAGSLTAAQQQESNSPVAAPATGQGANAVSAVNSPLGAVFSLLAVLLMAGAGLVSVRRYRAR